MPARSTRPSIRTSSLAFAVWALAAAGAGAQDLPPLGAVTPGAELPLQLEVFRNGEATGLIAAFRRRADGELMAHPDEIRALGLLAPPGAGELALGQMPGVSYRYDETGQRLFVQAQAAAIAPTVISLRPDAARRTPSRDWGGVLNYSVSVDAGRARGASGAFEARAFGPFGMADATFGATARRGERRLVRLDSAWTNSDPERATTWRVGDLITGGLAWTRPVRLGGVQFGRDFATRPDLVTMPTPELSASAAAPSTLDVMLGGSVLLSRRVSAGPVQVTDLPTQGQGVARLVLRDAFGAEQVVSASYFATPELLRPGLMDFSAEAGFARYGFGVASGDYGDQPMAAATVRYGVSDRLTLQGHGEAGAGVVNLGAGAVRRLGSLGIGSVAVAASHREGAEGALFNAAFQGRMGPVSLAGQVQQTVGEYDDLASASAARGWMGADADGGRAPRRLAQLSASTPLNLAIFERLGDFPALAVTYAFADVGGRRRSLFTSTIQYGLRNGMNLQAAAYASGAGRRERGFYLALSAPLGGARTGTAGVDNAQGRTSAFAEVRHQEGPEIGDLGWRLRVDQGRADGMAADVTYRAPFGRLSARAVRFGGGTNLEARADGAVAWIGRPFVAADRLDGAFAAVDVGAPDVKVSFQNRPIGRTGQSGRILVSGLGAYDVNLIAIEAADIGLHLLAPRTRIVVSPPRGAGAHVAFGVGPAPAQAIVSLRLAGGAAPPPGAMASLDGGPFDQVVGYDGQLFIADAGAARRVQVDLGDGETCVADLNIQSSPGTAHATTADCR